MGPTQPRRQRRILFLDAYDSFSNNIVALLTTLLDAQVSVLSIDSAALDSSLPGFASAWATELAHYDAVVCGPGPGSPEHAPDVGLMTQLWALPDTALVPVLGVCLGFQSLVASCGARVRRLRRGLHGMTRHIARAGDGSNGGDIFANVGPFKATLYHSLCMDIGQDGVPDSAWKDFQRTAPAVHPDIIPLAWAEEPREDGVERILMAARHATKPFWGVQYHPESVCTEAEGNKVIVNWFQEALQWNASTGRTILSDDDLVARRATHPTLVAQIQPATMGLSTWWQTLGIGNAFEFRTLQLPAHVQAPAVLETLGSRATEHILLDSANAGARAGAKADVRGRYSILALDVDEAVRLEHHTGETYATLRFAQAGTARVRLSQEVSLLGYQGIWGFVADFHRARGLPDWAPAYETPFVGGFMGYVTYEQGLHSIGVALPEDRGHARPDVCLAWITRSVVLDHAKGLLHIQHLRRPGADDRVPWVDQVKAKLVQSEAWQVPGSLVQIKSPHKTRPRGRTTIQAPQTKAYESKVLQCQEFIAAGESYELCLTDQTHITRPRSDTASGKDTKPKQRRRSSVSATPVPLTLQGGSPVNSWQLFKTLRARQPAPFASYMRLGGATLVSASPERFLCYDRRGLCSMRPMKGTVRKSEAVATLAQAERILHVPKEEAENLMIVDLVRHDLHGICGAGGVTVPHLLQVEEYQSVFQMVTVVEGQLPRDDGAGGGYTGLDVLAASLPPGSMTGAPKKRSCELLRQVEGEKERSLYSGVVGYMCVTGAGDWSVTIRSMFRWEDETAPAGPDGEPHEVWHIGAGGAVTILSTPEGEREEMFTKLAGPLGVFGESG